MKCSFCKVTVPQGRGKVFVKNDGKVFNFCSSKCDKNFQMKRVAKKQNWIRKPLKSKEEKAKRKEKTKKDKPAAKKEEPKSEPKKDEKKEPKPESKQDEKSEPKKTDEKK